MEIILKTFSPLQIGLMIAFCAVGLIQLIYFWGFFSRLAFYRRRHTSSELPPVSVIITSHSELNFLGDNLPFILEQDYPHFEVLVVNDTSDDDTSDFLRQLALDNEKLHIVEMKQSLNWFKGKKFPLSIGIKSARYNHLVLTDADCHPLSNQWLREIVSTYKPNTEIVLGYSTFETTSKINRLLRFTAFYDALFFLSMALARIPFKGVGKNLSYSRPLFYQQNGFIFHYIIKAGDDELFVNKAADNKNTEVVISHNSKVVSQKPISFSGWLKREKTRLSLRKSFKLRHRFLLSLYALTSWLFYGLFAALLLFGVSWMIALPLVIIKLISQWVLFRNSMKKLSEKGLWLISPFLELFLMLVDLILWVVLLFSRKNKWA